MDFPSCVLERTIVCVRHGLYAYLVLNSLLLKPSCCQVSDNDIFFSIHILTYFLLVYIEIIVANHGFVLT